MDYIYMKSLQTYILEARTRVGDIKSMYSREDIEALISDIDHIVNTPVDIYTVIDRREGKDARYNRAREFERWVVSNFGKKAFGALIQLIQEMKDELSPKEIYNVISRIPLDRMDRFLGYGATAVVLELGDDKVIKWYLKGHPMSPDARNFYNLCKTRKYKDILPIVYRVGKRYVIMEKLVPGGKEADSLVNAVRYNLVSHEYGYLADVLQLYYNDPSGKNKEAYEYAKDLFHNRLGSKFFGEVFDWSDRMAYILIKVLKDPYGFPGDFKADNMGFRPGSKEEVPNIIYFDI